MGPTRPSSHHSFISSSLFTMKAVFILTFLLAAATATKTKLDTKGLACYICMDVIGDLDNFLTDDTTQEEILSFVKELCHLLGQILGELRESMQRHVRREPAGHYRCHRQR